MDLKTVFLKIPREYIHFVEHNLYEFIQNDVLKAQRYLAAAFYQIIHQKDVAGEQLNKDAKIRMSFGHIPSALLGGGKLLLESNSGIDIRDSSNDEIYYAEVLVQIQRVTSDFKIMSLDANYTRPMLRLKSLFNKEVKDGSSKPFACLPRDVRQKSAQIIEEACRDGDSPIAVEFLYEFIRCFGADNLVITNTPITNKFARQWGIGGNISRITTGDNDKEGGSEYGTPVEEGGFLEDHTARINFGDTKGARFAHDMFEIIESKIKARESRYRAYRREIQREENSHKNITTNSSEKPSS